MCLSVCLLGLHVIRDIKIIQLQHSIKCWSWQIMLVFTNSQISLLLIHIANCISQLLSVKLGI